jgi:hypothetical protein
VQTSVMVEEQDEQVIKIEQSAVEVAGDVEKALSAPDFGCSSDQD